MFLGKGGFSGASDTVVMIGHEPKEHSFSLPLSLSFLHTYKLTQMSLLLPVLGASGMNFNSNHCFPLQSTLPCTWDTLPCTTPRSSLAPIWCLPEIGATPELLRLPEVIPLTHDGPARACGEVWI